MSDIKPTAYEIGNPDGTWTDLAKYVAGGKLTFEQELTAEDEKRWRDLMAGLETATFTIAGTFAPESERYEISGTYRECQVCHAPPRVAPLPEGWTVSLHRAPNPKGSHLKTEEPIYISLHTPECIEEQR